MLLILLHILVGASAVNLVPNSLIQSQSSLSTTYSQTNSCLCDIVPTLCDQFCCCDTLCGSQADVWNQYKRCSEKTYANTYMIPMCTERPAATYQDLYQPFRIAYNILKGLGCVSTKSVDESLFFINQNVGPSQEQHARSQAMSSAQDSLQAFISTIQFVPTFTLSLKRQLQATQNFGGLCSDQMAIFQKIYEDVGCTEVFNNLTHLNANLDRFSYTYFIQPISLNSVSFTPTIGNVTKASPTYQLGSNILLPQAKPICTPSSANENSCSCTNMVYEADYTIQLNSTASDQIIGISVDLIIQTIGATFPCDSEEIRLPQVTSVYYTQANLSIFEYSSNPGYLIGSNLNLALGQPLTFLDSSTGKSKTIIQLSILKQPLRFGMFDGTGQCSLSTGKNINLQDAFEIKFLNDAQYSCVDFQNIINATNYCQTTLYLNFLQNLQYIGIYGNSNPSYTHDWIQIQLKSYSSTSTTAYCPAALQFPQLRIFYSAYGMKTKENYRINYATVEFIDQNTFALDRKLNLFIQFTELPNGYHHFKAPPPQIVPYLANDVLYPFFIASGHVLPICYIIISLSLF